MSSSLPPDVELAAGIRCILSDVDGVMTDGQIIYDGAGIETKSFHVRDGLGIQLWMRSGHRFGIITARDSPVVARRGQELGVTAIAQGAKPKWPAAEKMIHAMGLRPDQVCYIGDDLPDLSVMRHVALTAAPADAAFDVRRHAHWTMACPGGRGAVRELIERLLRAQNRWEEHVQD